MKNHSTVFGGQELLVFLEKDLPKNEGYKIFEKNSKQYYKQYTQHNLADTVRKV